MSTLQSRFEAFMRTENGFEDIDALLHDSDPDGKKRADYLINNRTIIVEQKVLDSNPIDKPQKFFDRLMEDGKVLAYGTVGSNVIFNAMPNGQSEKRKMLLKLTDVIANNVSHADKQARDTREIFDIPKAMSILVILNEKAEMLTCELVRYALQQTFAKTDDQGAPRYRHLDGVIFLTEHEYIMDAGRKAFPINCYVLPHSPHQKSLKVFFDHFQPSWAAFNNAPLFHRPTLGPLNSVMGR